MKPPPRHRAQDKRDEKLALVREQVASGELVIRQMTAAERKGQRLRTAGAGLSMSTTYCLIHWLSSRSRSPFSFQLPICSR